MPTTLNKDSAEYEERMMVVIRELQGGSDRAVAIVGGAWVEEALQGTLHAAFQPEPGRWKRIVGSHGTLSTFAAKIDIVVLLGLVTKSIASDLKIIRDIRNDFAHNVVHRETQDRLSFESPSVKDQCLALRCIAHEKLTNPRHAFIRACAVLYADFEAMQTFVQVPHLGTVTAHNEDD